MQANKEPIWVKLPRLPPHPSNLVIFRIIGDALGTYVDANMYFKVTGDMTVARILVLLDLQEGIMSDIFLNTMVGDVIQDLDYEGVPFRCHRCHSTNNLVAQCHHPFRGNLLVEGRKEWSQDGGSLKEVHRILRTRGRVRSTLVPCKLGCEGIKA